MDKIEIYMRLVPAAPLLSAILCAALGPCLLKRRPQITGWITTAALAISFVASILLFGSIRYEQTRGDFEAEQLLEPDGSPRVRLLSSNMEPTFYRISEVWTWVDVEHAMGQRDFRIAVALRADSLTSIMLCMVTFVGTLVAIFATGYMKNDQSYWRFFSYVSLFVFSMTMLVSVSNFAMLFVFWEAVGVCSYLLIGFWYTKPEAAAAGMKAFLVNRIGDFGFALALFLIWTTYGTLDYHSSSTGVPEFTKVDQSGDGKIDDTEFTAYMREAPRHRIKEAPFAIRFAQLDTNSDSLIDAAEWPLFGIASPIDSNRVATARSDRLIGHATIRHGVLDRPSNDEHKTGSIALAICLLLMLGACGKSAQFPLHVWLPDAMEGPTPVSALIHAATMVTAGVYMVTRCSPLFAASPDAQLIVCMIGGFTALLGGLIALTQYDLKRVLAYSTVSQLGYMFIGLGVGTFAGIAAGMFHLFTHAFFKALLFLGAGSVMHAMGNIIDMRRFGGLKRLMPITYATFLCGCVVLAGFFPFSGFWSKDAIIGSVHEKAHALEIGTVEHHGNNVLSAAGTGEAIILKRAESVYSLFSEDAAAKIYLWIFYVAVFTAFLTAFYTFRAFFMTFHGEERIPAEAGDHAQESPSSMTGPLVILAVLAAVLGFAFHAQFPEFLARTPSLAERYVGSHHIEFHLNIAVMSNLVAFAGVGLAAYLYLGGAREASLLVRLFNSPWYQQLFDVNSMAQLSNTTWVKNAHGQARALGLGWLATMIGRLFLMFGLVISAPLILLSFASPYRLSQNKFYFDELYQFLIVKPLTVLARMLYAIDRTCIDGAVNLAGRIPVFSGNLMRSLQMGLTPFYALSMVLGVVLLILVRLLWLPS